jgi:hypothetical protein
LGHSVLSHSFCKETKKILNYKHWNITKFVFWF